MNREMNKNANKAEANGFEETTSSESDHDTIEQVSKACQTGGPNVTIKKEPGTSTSDAEPIASSSVSAQGSRTLNVSSVETIQVKREPSVLELGNVLQLKRGGPVFTLNVHMRGDKDMFDEQIADFKKEISGDGLIISFNTQDGLNLGTFRCKRIKRE